MKVVPFEPWHLDWLSPQEAQLSIDHQISPEIADHFAECQSFSGLVNGKVVACSGVVPFWGGRGVAWAILDKDCGPHFKAIHQAVYNFLETCNYQRVEAYVDLDHPAAHRWMKMLGFEIETAVAHKIMPSGKDGAVYARIR